MGREDRPITAWLFGWGAAVVLVLSFVALALLWPRPRLERAPERRVAQLPPGLEVPLGLLGVGLFVVPIYAGFAGEQVDTANLLPTLVYVAFWVGLLPLQLLLGDVFAAVNPWRAVGRAAGWASRRVAGGALPEPMAYPPRLGRWPAALGILAFAWLELVSTSRGDPSTLAVLALAYAAIQLVGMSLDGVRAWERHGDAFAVYFGLFARLSPLRWERGLVRPAAAERRDLARAGPRDRGAAVHDDRDDDVRRALQRPAVGRRRAAHHRRGRRPRLRPGHGAADRVHDRAGRLRVPDRAPVSRRRCEDPHGRARAHGGGPRADVRAQPHADRARLRGRALLLAARLPAPGARLPGVQPAGRALADGDGGLLGTAAWGIDYAWIGSRAIWNVQVGALVAGHVAGLVLAHDRALTTFDQPAEATRSQYWMLVIMVAFTSLGLWLLAAR